MLIYQVEITQHFTKVGEAGNPIVMFFNIFTFLNNCCTTNDFSIKLHYIDEHYSEYHGLFDKASQTYKYMNVKKTRYYYC